MNRKENTSLEYKYSTYNVFKFMCKVARYACGESFWYETEDDGKCLYVGYILLSLYYFITFGNICLEAVLHTYPNEFRADSILISMAHTVILIRIYFYSFKKKEIKELIKDMVDVCREYEEDHIYLKQYKKLKFCVILHVVIFYLLEASFLFDSMRRYFFEDKPLVIIPGYWPKYEDDTTVGLIFKFNMFVYIIFMAATILAKDLLVIIKLIVLSYKFTTLRHYFENLWNDFDKDTITITELKNKCLKGIKMHQELLRITKRFRSLYNAVLSIEVIQGCGLVILIMVKITFTSEETLINIIMSIFYMVAVVPQLALFMWNAGEMTYQASMLSTAIFYCGWHLRPVKCEHSRASRLVLMGCLQAQRPLVLKAFGMLDVSYSSFLSVMQTSYSIFAVFRGGR